VITQMRAGLQQRKVKMGLQAASTLDLAPEVKPKRRLRKVITLTM
jgi:hypothetical protein